MENIRRARNKTRENAYSRVSLPRSPRDSLKYFEISVHRHNRYAELRKNIEQPHFTNVYVIWLLKLYRYILKILWKSGEIAPLFSTIFSYLLLVFHFDTGTRFSLRDKRLFEISDVEITRVDCIWFEREREREREVMRSVHGLKNTKKNCPPKSTYRMPICTFQHQTEWHFHPLQYLYECQSKLKKAALCLLSNLCK